MASEASGNNKRPLDQVLESGDAMKENSSTEAKRQRLEGEEIMTSTENTHIPGETIAGPSNEGGFGEGEETGGVAGDKKEAKKRPPRRNAERTKEYKGRGRGGRAPSYRDRNQEKPREPSLGPDGEELPKALRLPKRQCALLMGFCGSGYSGMQM